MALPSAAARHRHGAAVLLAVVVAVAVGAAIAATGVMRGTERQTLSARFALRHVPRADDVAVVAVDDATFDAVHPRRWPFPRSWHARVVDRLHRAGARAIVYDVQFTEATSPRE